VLAGAADLLVELFPRFEDVAHMSVRPQTERFHGLPQGAATLDQLVIHTLRSLPLSDRAVALARERGVVRTRELTTIGISRCYLTRMCEQGLLEKVSAWAFRAASASYLKEKVLPMTLRL
jgi:putative AbiEi antitoxin of type IV toxin-antitoxin system